MLTRTWLAWFGALSFSVLAACAEDDTGTGASNGGSGGSAGAGGQGGGGAQDAGSDALACSAHCNNSVRDCGEIDVDCGSPCAACVPRQLAAQDAMGGYPRIAVASPDRVMLVWHRDNGTQDGRLRFRCYDGTAWSAMAQVTPGKGFEGYPWIVADNDSRFHVVYSNGLGDSRTTHYNRYDASDCSAGWHEPAETLPRAKQFSVVYPAVGTDDAGDAYVTFSQSEAGKLASQVSCTTNSECSAGYHCYVLGKYCIPDYTQQFTKRSGGAVGSGTWSKPEIISAGAVGKLAHHGSIFVESSTAVHAAWMHGDPGREIYYAKYDGKTWGTPEDTGIGAHMADVQADANNVFVFSNTARSASRPAAPLSGGKWSPVTSVSTKPTVINLIRLRIDQVGRLHGIWNENHRVMYSYRDASGSWQPPKPVSPEVVKDALYSSEPSLDVDADGNVHFVWTQADCKGCEFGSVWYLKSRYDEL